MSEAFPKPSLCLVDAPAETATRMFGRGEFVDPQALSQAITEEDMVRVRERLLGDFPEEGAAIAALATPADCQAFLHARGESRQWLERILATQGRFIGIREAGALSGGLSLEWGAKGIGFGQIHLYVGEDGKLHADTEMMSRHFLRSLLLRLADEIVIHD